MLSAAGGCELSTITRVKNAWKKFKDLLPVLPSRHISFKHMAVCTALLCGAQCSMPASAAKWQGNDQTDLLCQAARHCHHQVQWATCTAWHWGSGPYSEGEKAPMVWTCGTLQWYSQQPLTYRLMKSVGLGGPRWHRSSWQRGIAESGSSRLSTLKIDIP